MTKGKITRIMTKELRSIIIAFTFLLIACKQEKEVKRIKEVKETVRALPTEKDLSHVISLTNGEWAPYCSEKLPGGGVSAQITTAALAKEGFKTKYTYFNWTRALEIARQGEYRGGPGWFKSPEREKDFYYSDPIARVETVFFYRKDMAFDWQEISELSDYWIEGTRAYAYGELLDEAEKSKVIQLHRNENDLTGFRKLIGKRSELFICARAVGLKILRDNFSKEEREQITFHPRAISSKEIYLILNRKDKRNPALMKRFNAGLIKLRASGELAKFHQQLSSFSGTLADAGEGTQN
mgnify:CR=1 FL=1